MPADYNSAARALALPISPPRSPNQQRPQPPWSRRSESYSRRLSSEQGGTSFRDRTINNLERMGRTLYRTTEKMTWTQWIMAVSAGISTITVTILFFIFSEKIFAWLEPIAQTWRDIKGGWLILWALTFATAFPPVIGYSTCLTLAGFVYGFPNGLVLLLLLYRWVVSDKRAGGQSLLPPLSWDRLAPSSSPELFFRNSLAALLLMTDDSKLCLWC